MDSAQQDTPMEFADGTDGEAIEMRPDTPIEDIIFAHRYSVPLVPRAALEERMREYRFKPIGEIPLDIMRLYMRHLQMNLEPLNNLVVLPSIPSARKWY